MNKLPVIITCYSSYFNNVNYSFRIDLPNKLNIKRVLDVILWTGKKSMQ